MSDRIDIRPATVSDARTLAELRWEFRATRGDAPTETHGAFVARCAAWMARELGAGGSWRAWVATDEGRIVGHVWLQTIAKLPNPVAERGRHAYLSNLYVTPSARGGIGTRLLEAALAQASAADVDCILLWPSARSRSLYARYGFTATGGVLERTCP